MKLQLKPNHLPVILLLAAASLLLLKVSIELTSTRQPDLPLSRQNAPDTPDVTLALLPEFALPPMQRTYKAMLARPLFVSSRRPPPVSADASASPSFMRKGQFILLGVMLTGEKNIAMLREIATGKVLNLEQGKEINGIQLELLAPEKVTLKQGDEREELVLKIQPPEKLPEPAVARENAAGKQDPAAAAPGVAQRAVPVARRPLSDAMQELIERRRASHGVKAK